MDISLYLPIALSIALIILILLIILIFRKPKDFSNEFSQMRISQDAATDKLGQIMRDEFRAGRVESASNNKYNQELLGSRLENFGNQQSERLLAFQNQLQGLITTNQTRIFELQETVLKSLADSRRDINQRLESIQKDNTAQLEKMRQTVDEKLQKTLEQRLGQSFELVSKQLEAVQKGLGEMQQIASGVGDLKRVLSNVKTRGTLGEIQLGNILEQILSPEQYSLNVATIPDSNNFVEFAIKLPGKDDDGKQVWLPIDSKFPMDRYETLMHAYDSSNNELIEKARKELVSVVKLNSKDIHDKYISPPYTTDFAILFLPTEGLYAEIARDPVLQEEMQRKYKIIPAGPTNLAALLNSLQMGFRSLAIEKRSSEVWKILSSVKTEFGKFGDVLDKVQEKLNSASKTITEAGTRTRQIERKLRNVQELPDPASTPGLLEDGLDMEELTNPMKE